MTIQEGFLDVGNGHSIYWSTRGNPHGLPLLTLHGGPGSYSKPAHVDFIDHDRFYLIQFDQRGCGQSTPTGSLQHNTTQHLVADIEKLRTHLGVYHWVVRGGSWGSTLALVYAQTHPQSVRALVLNGIFLCRDQDINWLINGVELAPLFPDLFAERKRILKRLGLNKANIVHDLYQAIVSDDQNRRQLAALYCENWDGQLMSANTQPQLLSESDMSPELVRSNTIYMHYVVNHGFLSNNQILANTPAINHLPTFITHGRLDFICPLTQALELHRALPHSRLTIVPGNGHHHSEPGIKAALNQVINQELPQVLTHETVV